MQTGDTADALAEFRTLFSQIRPSTPTAPVVSAQTIADLIERTTGDVHAKRAAVASALALQTPLTVDHTTRLAEQLVPESVASTDAQTAKDAASKAGADLASAVPSLAGSAELSLSQPSPLSANYRIVFAALLVVVTLLSLIFVFVASPGTARFVTLAVIGGLAWLGVVLFVMGYQTVDVKASTGQGSSSSDSSGGSGGSSAQGGDGSNGSGGKTPAAGK